MLQETISHYRILRKLGAGGMGEVYLAEDIRLFRQVALKFLPASYQYDPDRRSRFLKEARAASALRSPNSAAIHDIGEHEGLNFIVMEYVEGELLSHRIQRSAIEIHEAIDTTAQVAEALDEAHSSGIIHRDIKSANIIITPRGLVKLLDFGLAQITNQVSQDSARYQTTMLNPDADTGEVKGDTNPTVALNESTTPTASFPETLSETAILEIESNPTTNLDQRTGETLALDESANQPPAGEGIAESTVLLSENHPATAAPCEHDSATILLDESDSSTAVLPDDPTAGLSANPYANSSASQNRNAWASSDSASNIASQSDSASQATTIGLVIGTVPYMSPEQAAGLSLDHRTDLFSLGVVLYEMLTRRLPFTADTQAELIENILRQEPTPVSQLNPQVSPELERIVQRCLEKPRERRYASARELIQALRQLQKENATSSLSEAIASAHAQPAKKARARRSIDSLAILPFENASTDADAEYLSDGITESIINNLSQLPKLKVMARSTVFRYKGKSLSPQEVANELQVRAVLTGRVFHRGDTLIIKAELVDAGDGSQLWGEQFNRNMADIFAVEEEISKEISEKLRLKLSGEQKQRLTKRHTDNSDAYQEYLKGRYHWNKRTREGLLKGIEQFNKAIDLDPNYALAHAGLADSYNIIASYSSSPPSDAFPKARSAATRALSLDNTLTEAHISLAFVLFGYDWDWTEAEKEFRQALALNPGYAIGHLWYSLFLVAMGRHAEAMSEMEKALELDPLSLPINTNLGWLFYLERKYDDAIRQLKKTLEMEPNYLLARRRLCQVYLQQERFDEADIEFKRALALSGEDVETIAAQGYLYALTDRPTEARQVLDQLTTMMCHRYVPAYFFAKIFMGLGDKDRAFEYLRKALEERYGLLAYMKVEPEVDRLRDDERFDDLAHRVGLD
jgi:serine/threonine protein kinase/Tfp pilus assembly protein PilF